MVTNSSRKVYSARIPRPTFVGSSAPTRGSTGYDAPHCGLIPVLGPSRTTKASIFRRQRRSSSTFIPHDWKVRRVFARRFSLAMQEKKDYLIQNEIQPLIETNFPQPSARADESSVLICLSVFAVTIDCTLDAAKKRISTSHATVGQSSFMVFAGLSLDAACHRLNTPPSFMPGSAAHREHLVQKLWSRPQVV